jgi:hypothetical protein
MTVPRTAIGDAVLRMLGQLGEVRVYEITGKTVDAHRKSCNPNAGRSYAIDDYVALVAACNVAGLPHGALDALSDRIRAEELALGGRVATPSLSVDAALRKLGTEAGDVFRAASEALDDGTLDLNDRRHITREAYELRDQVDLLIRAVEPPADEAGPRLAASRAG